MMGWRSAEVALLSNVASVRQPLRSAVEGEGDYQSVQNSLTVRGFLLAFTRSRAYHTRAEHASVRIHTRRDLTYLSLRASRPPRLDVHEPVDFRVWDGWGDEGRELVVRLTKPIYPPTLSLPGLLWPRRDHAAAVTRPSVRGVCPYCAIPPCSWLVRTGRLGELPGWEWDGMRVGASRALLAPKGWLAGFACYVGEV